MYGDTVEALIAAIYLDYGFRKVRDFVLKKLIYNHLDIDHIVQNNSNFKSLLLEWANKNNKSVSFETILEEGFGHQRAFTVEVSVEDRALATGKGNSKKKAEQEAAQAALAILKTDKSDSRE